MSIPYSDTPDRPRKDGRVIWGLLVALVVLFGGLYVAGYFFTGDKIARGTTVAGVDIGGRSQQGAERVLTETLSDRTDEPIEVSAGDAHTTITPSTAGLALDAAASVAQAGVGRSWRPDRMWDYFTGGDDLDAVIYVEKSKLDKAIDPFLASVEQKAKNGSVVFEDGEANPVEPVVGSSVDRDEASDLIAAAYLDGDEPVELEVQVVRPEITAADVARAMDEFANPAMTAPVVISLGTEDVVLRPERFSKALSMKASKSKLVPRLDDKLLLKTLKQPMSNTASAPQDATIRVVDGRPKVIPAKKGVTFDTKDVTSKFLDLVVAEGDGRTLEVDSVVDRPSFTTQDAKKLGVKEQVSEFTTYYPHADYRNTNLGRAAALIDDTLMKPGETFSLNGTVGERTKKNGFAKGFIISDGVFKEDFGGGVSQVATTTFNAAFFAGLEDVEHKPHSFYIDRYPVGREATVAWPVVDLKFKNDTSHGVLVQAWIVPSSASRQGEMHVRMWSTKVWDIGSETSNRYNLTSPETRQLEGDECVPNEGYGGFDIDVFRLFHRAGDDELVRRERMHTTYTPSDTVVCS